MFYSKKYRLIFKNSILIKFILENTAVSYYSKAHEKLEQKYNSIGENI